MVLYLTNGFLVLEFPIFFQIFERNLTIFKCELFSLNSLCFWADTQFFRKFNGFFFFAYVCLFLLFYDQSMIIICLNRFPQDVYLKLLKISVYSSLF